MRDRTFKFSQLNSSGAGICKKSPTTESRFDVGDVVTSADIAQIVILSALIGSCVEGYNREGVRHQFRL